MIGERIKKQREFIEVTQQELAKEAKLSQECISQIESGVRKPSIGSLERILSAIGLKMIIVSKTFKEHYEL